MGKYTEEEILRFKKITLKIASDYLGISTIAIGIGMRNNLMPIGLAIHNEDKDRKYVYDTQIIPPRRSRQSHLIGR